MTATPDPSFPFHPWVRRSCRRALLWGLGLAALLTLALLWLRGPGQWNWERGFGVLLAYSALFWLSLLKIWWTAGGEAVRLEPEALAYRPLWAFWWQRIPYAAVLAMNPKAGTRSLRLVVERRGKARELFLNMGVIDGQQRFVKRLGRRLDDAGLNALPDRPDSWAREGWEEEPVVAGVGG